MDQLGNVSEPFVKKGTLKKEEYLDECITKRLIPFIDKYHNRSDVLFWPDMATIHYSGVVTQALNSNNIEFIPKDHNPPNCPQARPIEKFWAICKKAYSKTSITSKTTKQFTRIWRKVSFSVAEKSAHTLMARVRRVLKDIGTNGPYQPIRHKK